MFARKPFDFGELKEMLVQIVRFAEHARTE